MAFIKVEEVSKIYQLGKINVPALNNISVTVEKGEFVVIMGPSGSGKSTFMNILGCLDTPTAGRYFLESKNIGELNKNQLAEIRNKKIGFVFQGFNLLPRSSAQENVELPLLYNGLPARERKERAMWALKSVGLEDHCNYHPNQLSGGQQQRVALARALVNHPAIILADEPTGNLDSKTSVEIMELFLKLNQESQITIILVTHEPDIAAYGQRTIKFLDGKIISDTKK